VLCSLPFPIGHCQTKHRYIFSGTWRGTLTLTLTLTLTRKIGDQATRLHSQAKKRSKKFGGFIAAEIKIDLEGKLKKIPAFEYALQNMLQRHNRTGRCAMGKKWAKN